MEVDLMAKKPARGRPPLGSEALMTPRTVRFSQAIMREIDNIRAERAYEQPDFGQIVRELVAEGLKSRKKRS